MHDLICDVISHCVSNFNMGIITVGLYDKIVLKISTEKRSKSNKFYTNFHLADGFGVKFMSMNATHKLT